MKAILVIDMPRDCFECPCMEGEMGWCQADDDAYREGCYENIRPNWCPLKPIPSKYELTTEKGNRYAVGYNDCIDDILGGEDDR